MIFNKIKEKYLFLILVLIYLVFISQFFSYYPLWDGYYFFSILRRAISNTTDFNSFLDLFNLNAHPSMGYSLYMALGQIISFDNQYLLHAQNALLNIIASFCFYKTMIFFVGKEHKLESILATAIFIFHPLNNAVLL